MQSTDNMLSDVGKIDTFCGKNQTVSLATFVFCKKFIYQGYVLRIQHRSMCAQGWTQTQSEKTWITHMRSLNAFPEAHPVKAAEFVT